MSPLTWFSFLAHCSGVLYTEANYAPNNAYFVSSRLGALRIGDDSDSKNWAFMVSCPPFSLPAGQFVQAAVLEVQTDLSQPDAIVGVSPFSDDWSPNGRPDFICDVVSTTRCFDRCAPCAVVVDALILAPAEPSIRGFSEPGA